MLGRKEKSANKSLSQNGLIILCLWPAQAQAGHTAYVPVYWALALPSFTQGIAYRVKGLLACEGPEGLLACSLRLDSLRGSWPRPKNIGT